MSVVDPIQRPMPHRDNTPLTCVLFDFGGTLDANGVAWKERFLRLCRDEGIVIASERFDAVFYAADDALVGAVPATLSLQDTVVRLTQRLTHALGVGDLTLGAKIAQRFLQEALDQLSTNVALLAHLGRRYRLGVVSNFYGNLATVCHDVGLTPFLTVVVDSACVGCLKPDPQIFLHALAALRAMPCQTLFVGDSLRRDMAGARAVGMPHVWLTTEPPPEAGPCCPDDRVVHTLDALLEWLL
jgi:putative hydrolase of the HAD superfamily